MADDNEQDDAPDLDDLGDLDDGDEADEKDEDDEEFVPLTKEETAKLKRKLQRQEDRITRLTGKTPRGKTVDDKLAAALKGKGGDDDDEDDERPGQAAVAAAEERAKRGAGVAALMGAGLTREQSKRAVRLLDLRHVELDEDGDADLEDEIDELKEQFPDLFATPVRYRRGPGTARRTPDEGRKKLTPTENTDRKLLKAAGFQV